MFQKHDSRQVSKAKTKLISMNSIEDNRMPSFYEFFAGGGMVRSGLGEHWNCLFANDFDHKKSAVYRSNFGNANFVTSDVRTLDTSEIPGHADLTWASFPCQDLSLAGGGAGLKGDRSGTFWPFWELMKKLQSENRNSPIIALENVCGTLNSHNGKDFAAIGDAFDQLGYRFGAIVIDASLFVPQSRPRLFIIGVRQDVFLPKKLILNSSSKEWHTKSLLKAYDRLSNSSKQNWIWWNLARPAQRNTRLSDLIEDNPKCVSWHTNSETRNLLTMMSDVNLAKVKEAKNYGHKMVGTIYKRTRRDKYGRKVQRAEIRFDDIAGCLRTPAGGSSRQLILIVEGDNVRSRLISSRETARLMGLPEDYQLPKRYNEAYHLTGDGVVVPVIRHLAHNIFENILTISSNAKKAAA